VPQLPKCGLQEVTPQRLAAGDEAVMAVRRREWRQERERLVAQVAQAATNPDPIVVSIMGLFAPATVTDDRILHANRASAQNDFRARLSPIGF
jgi:hypothetical protein